jgi:hypothetical protein
LFFCELSEILRILDPVPGTVPGMIVKMVASVVLWVVINMVLTGVRYMVVVVVGWADGAMVGSGVELRV